MKNNWLNRYTEVKIKQVESFDIFNRFHGKWYATKQLKSEVDDCQITDSNYPDSYYLHKDGTWYRNTTCYNGEWTGYFDAKEEIMKLLEQKIH